MKRETIGQAVAVTLCLVTILAGVAVAQLSAPALDNPSFEPPYSLHSAPEVEVANGWYPDWVPPDHSLCAGGYCVRPEYKPINEAKYVTKGAYSQKFFWTYANGFGGVYQHKDVEPGLYTLACDMFVISETKDGSGHGQLSAMVGIHPWGGGMFSHDMIWGKPSVGEGGWIYDEWVRVSVTAPVWGGRATLAAVARNEYPTKGSTVFVDNCTLEAAEYQVPATPAPCPTGTFPSIPPCEPCPTVQPGEGIDYNLIRTIVGEEVREELDNTGLSSR